ncbi:alpha-amylase family protein [Nocardioides marmoribigeumensis]|uniref:Amylosucrase n=1 Tax=Nocardioides marmoribigeumensis TaxID=433649 RepID=A0ABU2BX87_9ACTN|nr:alpha-amylase family protein [Nocardioides marmoribigeumensis]MDR7363013.1 amylosucrase [Nocardioides marmoribigeumensis]
MSPGRPPDARVRDAAVARLGLLEGEAFAARFDLVRHDLHDALALVYGEAAGDLVGRVVTSALDAAAERAEPLRVLDRVREVDPSWFLDGRVGYICYADRFAGTLAGVGTHLDHLAELGVGYLHLMPLLEPREGENDGGYAVKDYDAVDPRLGSMDDLERLAGSLHERGIALCVDLVLNHTAREHEWARAALAGDPHHRAFYRFFPDRELPDAYERTLPEVFPDMAPGSFTQLETGEWVWTTFHEFQWDLDWTNPDVFEAMLGVLLRLGNHGIDVVRLDAAPFLGKRMGTDCQNQPEAHALLQALRALTRLAMPGLVLKAEAIVGPDQLLPYLGAHDHERPECQLAYDNQLMVMLWSALATRDVSLAAQSLSRRTPAPVGTGWVTYVRCHDDIGWAVGDSDAGAIGLDPESHRRFLAAFYAGDHRGSFSRGMDFQVDPVSGSRRTSGMTASLAGLESALVAGDEAQVTAALLRIELLHSVVYSFGGIPLVYMGDEIGQRNDAHWDADPAHADDNRWLHRPLMNWEAAAHRHDPSTPEGQVFEALVALGRARGSTDSLRSDAATRVVKHGNHRVLAHVREHPRASPVLCLACFSDEPQTVEPWVLDAAGVGAHPTVLHSSRADRTAAPEWPLRLPAWSFVWLTR